MTIRALRNCLLTLFAITGVLAFAPAHAQFYGWREPGGYVDQTPAMSPRAIQARLARQGYRLAGPMRFNGDVITADAIGPDGIHSRLVIDPDDGVILQRFARAEPRPLANLPGDRDLQDFASPLEPNVIYGPNSGYLGDGSPAPARNFAPGKAIASKPTPPKPVVQKAQPKAVARNVPDAPAPGATAGKPIVAPPAPAMISPKAPTVARTAPADVAHPPVIVSPQSAGQGTNIAKSTAASGASAAPAPVKPAPVAQKPPAKPRDAQTGGPMVNGVPLNPLD